MTQSQNRSGLSGFVRPLLFTHRFEEELIREKGEAALPPPRLLRPFSACSAFSLLLEAAQLPPPPPTSDAIRVMVLFPGISRLICRVHFPVSPSLQSAFFVGRLRSGGRRSPTGANVVLGKATRAPALSPLSPLWPSFLRAFRQILRPAARERARGGTIRPRFPPSDGLARGRELLAKDGFGPPTDRPTLRSKLTPNFVPSSSSSRACVNAMMSNLQRTEKSEISFRRLLLQNAKSLRECGPRCDCLYVLFQQYAM